MSIRVFDYQQDPKQDRAWLTISNAQARQLEQAGAIRRLSKRTYQRTSPPELPLPSLPYAAYSTLQFDYDYPEQSLHPELAGIPALLYPMNLAQHYGRSARRWRQ